MRSAAALVRCPMRPLRAPAAMGVTPLVLSSASRVGELCESSLGRVAAPPDWATSAFGFSVAHMRPGAVGIVAKPIAPGRMWATENENADVVQFGGDANC